MTGGALPHRLDSRLRGNDGPVLVYLVVCPAIHLWIGDQVRNDGASCPAVPALWIDESPMNLCEILGLQPKGVATLSFSSRKRPACAGMTV